MSDPRPLVPGLAALALAIGCQAALAAAPPATAARPPDYDVVIRGGTVYDGTGGAPFIGDVALRGDRIAYIGAHAPGRAAEEFSAHGKAVAPGFVNMLAHPEESLLIDGRALSDLRQGVTLEVLGEDSMGPLSPEMKRLGAQRQGDIKYPIDWTTLGEYLQPRSSSAALRPTSLLTSAPAPCARTCSASATCSRAQRSSSRCARSCTRPWRRAPSASPPR